MSPCTQDQWICSNSRQQIFEKSRVPACCCLAGCPASPPIPQSHTQPLPSLEYHDLKAIGYTCR